jgi:uncharacterized membrane protein YeiH
MNLFATASSVGPRTLETMVIIGAFIFCITGALAAVQKSLDFFGVIVLSIVVGLSGGTIRDVMLGIPAYIIFDWRVVVAVVASGVVGFSFHTPLLRWRHSIMYLDALGLALFCVLGTDISYHAGAGALASAILGMITGIGGGVVRDVLLNEVPRVLRRGLCAIPALIGSTITVVGYEIHKASLWWYLMAGTLCLVVRVLGIALDVNLPSAKPQES